MADSTNERRPVRKLTVNNFSVIKEAELEFGKITVLIGPQASGKSLLCKLVYFLDRIVLEVAIDQVVRLNGFKEFRSTVMREFQRWFPNDGWGQLNWYLDYCSHQYQVRVGETATSALTEEPAFDFSSEFEEAYASRLKETLEDQQKRGFLLAPALQSVAATRFMKITGRGVWDAATYIPVERAAFVDMQQGYRVLANDPDPILAKFAVTYADSLKRDIPKRRVNAYLGGDIVQSSNGAGASISFPDGRRLPLTLLSSGSKNILAIISVLDMYEYRRRSSGREWLGQELYGDKLYEFDDLIIEEPEASVFPETQYSVVQEIATLSNEPDFNPHFTITTHSPYVLSVFGDLVKAGKVAKDDPKQRTAVASVIPESCWINVDDFAAYKIENGKLQSIFDQKTGQIDGDYLDKVSGKISDELGRLLEIQYGR
jgi:hypothetical protein